MITINFVNINDITCLEHIGRNCLPIYYDQNYIRTFLNDKNYLLLKAIFNNFIVGFVFCKIEENNIHILSIAVLEKYRRNNIGSELIKKIMSLYNNFTISLNVLETNLSAIKFYHKLGFSINKIIYNYYTTLNNKNALFMIYKKKLPDELNI